jgi:DNA-binding MarR family transcriptional regulator
VTDDLKGHDHIGWDLWRASQAWKRQFVVGMVSRGHSWYAEARGNMLQFIAAEPVRQTDIVNRSKLTKQAVQQFLDELENDGIIKRTPDPVDARARLVRLTAKGLKALTDANAVKREIEQSYERLLGKPDLARLKSALDKIAAAGE